MTESSSARMGILVLLAILTVSAATMLWLFWRFPLPTAVITLSVLAALAMSARLARSINVELQELDRSERV